MISPSTLLKDLVDDVVTIERSNLMNISVIFKSHQDPEFELTEATITTMTVEQDFAQNTTDTIQLNLDLRPLDLMTLVAHQSDLYAILKIEYIDPDSGEIRLEEAPEVYEFLVLIHELENLAKRYGIQTFANTDPSLDEAGVHTEAQGSLLSLDVQLISKAGYLFNRGSFHGILTECTIEQVVQFVAARLGVTKVNMIQPDNKVKYLNMVIPPNQADAPNLFEFLQYHYGVYTNGLRVYLTGNTLYVYPPYDMKLSRLPKLEILKVAPQSYIGSLNYHQLKGSTLIMVCNTDAIQQSLTSVAAENTGNARILARSDQMIDGQVDHNKMMLTDLGVVVSSNYDNSIKHRSVIARYHTPTINLFEHASRLAEGNAELLVIGWNYCRLFMIEPGMPVGYIFDEAEQLTEQSGQVESVSYLVDRSVTKNGRYTYTCTATLVIRSSTSYERYEV